ncbi:Sodium- and chloride-dependent glycine transporter 2 [Hypsibius exemplaris]|uniref:Transporter n=1 Tax=Hypsibius exemplaris TaxID=2072580 RepID=A0A1W0WVB7_HYPEX|nr:Sodium- and chloride-dependent glycine transporter 2 [Hypsibius exemplaris]
MKTLNPMEPAEAIPESPSTSNTPPPDYNNSVAPPSGVTATTADSKGNAVRQQWTSKTEFLLSCISLSVGLGNVWRFPYVAYANGGGAFLLPYIIVLALVGKPMYFMEIAFGQFHSAGPVKVWKRSVPFARGLGVAQTIVCFFIAIFYGVLRGDQRSPSCCKQKQQCHSAGRVHKTLRPSELKGFSAAQQYFDRVVLNKYEKGTMNRFSLSNMGGVNGALLGCLAGSWLIVFLSLVKGVKSAGKVMYITSTMPFIVLFILLGRGASLTNAVEGIKYFIIPQFDKLLTINTWRAAAEQMFFSLAVGSGSLIMLGSYNPFRNNCYKDSLIISILDSATSLTAGFAMFSILGYLAGTLDVGVENVVSTGPGLAFVTFPEATTQMPVPHLWAILFFVMLYTLGLGSEIGLLESVLVFFCDRYPYLQARRAWAAGVGSLVCFLIGIPFVTQGGEELLNIFNDYAAGTSVLFMAIFEMVMIMWIYGVKRFISNLKEMLGEKTGNMGYYMKTAWVVMSPGVLFFILIVTLVTYKPSHDPENPSSIPAWGDGLGWAIVAASVLQIPIWATVAVVKADGTTLKEKIYQSLWPDFLMVIQDNSLEMSVHNGDKVRSIHPALDGDMSERKAYVNSGFAGKDD